METKADKGYIAAVGTFDGVHRGHAFVIERLIAEAAAKGLKSKIITFSDHPLAVVAPHRCPAALTHPEARIRLLRSLGVDAVEAIPFDRESASLTAAQFLDCLHKEHNVEAVVMGFNNHIGSDRRTGADLRPSTSGVEIICLPELDAEAGVSSSAIRKALGCGNVSEAARLLGRPYQISGTVVSGKHLGRKFGFPTANVHPDDRRLAVPAKGVYAVDAVLPDGSVHRGMANIGHRPTIDHSDAPKSIEVNIFDFDDDLYGQHISIRFLKHLRDEQRFPDVDALISQLHLDREKALEI